MNVFVIPSWYPSEKDKYAGIFNKEQAQAMAHEFPSSQFALSTWGSHDPDLLLWGSKPVHNIIKLIKRPLKKASIQKLSANLLEYYTPAFTWSRKFFKGNIDNIIKLNENHFLDFQARFGKCSIIHAHSAHPAGWVAMHLATKYNIPYIITEHMSPFPFKDFLEKGGHISDWLMKPYKFAAYTIVVSPQQKEQLISRQITHVETIPNLTDESFFKPFYTLKPTTDPFTFFSLGRFEPQKGFFYLLEAFKQLLERHPQVRLRISGRGYEGSRYLSRAHELGISEHIYWLDELTRTEVLYELQQCNAFVLPSLHENLPLMLIEAIACGKPIISTRCGGPESIINEKNGMLVEPGDSYVLFKAMAGMVENIEQYPPKDIREDFCKRYSRPVICNQIMELYIKATTKHQHSVQPA